MIFKTLLIVFLQISRALMENAPEEQEEGNRNSKLLPIFQVIRFPNDICAGTSRNGTCYTSEECSSRGGSVSGSCASGFGVCCIFEMGCGSTTSDNVSYLVQTSTTSLTSPCTYTVCPCNSNICRIRYDFTTMVIAAVASGTVIAGNNPVATTGSSIGSCLTDTFSITAPQNQGSPIICGTNTGYHMVLDATDGECQEANFQIAPSTTTTRQWDIKVTQYACGEEDKAGPDSCLQYYTGTYGVIANFGFPPSASAVSSTTTHLKNQLYDICIRREKGYCYICYSQAITGSPGTTVSTQHSFGLSVSAAATAAQAMVGTDCTTDFIQIPQGMTATIAAITTVVAGIDRYCGRFLANADAATAGATVCSREYPFRVGVSFDNDEVQTSITASTHESAFAPSGMTGFKLEYFQIAC